VRVEREIDWLRCQPFQRDVSEAFRPYAANSIASTSWSHAPTPCP